MEESKGLDLDQAMGSVGPGWGSLVWNAWELIRGAGGWVTSVREKWGCLRVYYILPTGISTKTHELLDELESHSENTCEVCGNPGTQYPPLNEDTRFLPEHQRRVKTTCPRHTMMRMEGMAWPEILHRASIERLARGIPELPPKAEDGLEPQLYLEEEPFEITEWKRKAGIRDEPDTSDWAVSWSLERDLEDEEGDDLLPF